MHSPGYRPSRGRANPAAAVLARLRPDEALVEYQIVEDSLLIFVGRRTGLVVTTVAVPRGGLQSRVRLAGSWSHNETPDSLRALPVLRALGDFLIASSSPERRA